MTKDEKKTNEQKPQKAFLFPDTHKEKAQYSKRGKNVQDAIVKHLGEEGGVVTIENSFYYGGLIPEVPDNVKLVVLYEPPDLLIEKGEPMALYSRGMEIPPSSILSRKRLELLALELSASERPDIPRIAEDLIRIRRDHPREVVYNQPEA